MDIRHPLKDLDQQMIEWAVASQLPVLLLLTKADKLSQSARSKQVKMVRARRFYHGKVISMKLFPHKIKSALTVLHSSDQWFAPLFT